MNEFTKELEVILETDPLDLLKVRPKASTILSTDGRLIASFEEINAFMREHDREPVANRDIGERKLYSRLKGLRESSSKAAALAKFDTFNLLGNMLTPVIKEINTIDDILEDDSLRLLGDNVSEEADPNDIFKLKNIPKSINMPDHIARRRKCEEFEQFEPLFIQIQADLVSRKKVMKAFKSEKRIIPGEFFILQGMLVYVANVGNWEKKNFGNVNARLYCVFENGTESDILLRSLAAALWKDKNSSQVIDANQMEMLSETNQITQDDDSPGYIYILRSLSKNPKIKEIKDLYKIGYSQKPVKQRIQNAEQELTYLLGKVIVVSEFQTYNLNPQKLEMLLHNFFAESCLNFDIFDDEGKRHTPREWFIVPLHVIETAVQLLINGEIVNYRYDNQHQVIADK